MKRTQKVECRCTPEEKLQIQIVASYNKQEVSTYLRGCIVAQLHMIVNAPKYNEMTLGEILDDVRRSNYE